jgi:hypothetical protein
MKLQPPPKPKIIESISQFFDGLEETPRKVLLGGLIFLFIMAASTTLLLAYYQFEPQITAWHHRSPSSPTPVSISQLALATSTAQSLVFPPTSQPVQPSPLVFSTSTPSCSSASLRIGTNTWQLEAIQREADGSISVPSNTPGIAYWVSNLRQNNVFALSPNQENLDILNATQGGDEVTITWESCNTTTYNLSSIEAGSPDPAILLDQKTIGLVVYVPDSPLDPGLTLQGALEGETITNPPTAAPSSGEVDAEISLLDTTTSSDKLTLQVLVSIKNYGASPITLSASDIILTPEGSASLAIASSDPALPQAIQPGVTQTFTLVFPRPQTETATVTIYTVEYDLEGF